MVAEQETKYADLQRASERERAAINTKYNYEKVDMVKVFDDQI